jgi:hypothetical protein
MYEQMIPPSPIDVMREGLPSLRHGTAHMHPLAPILRRNDEEHRAYDEAAALFGLGFASHLKCERNVIKRSQVAYTGVKKPLNLGMEISMQTLDDVDFCDMFAETGTDPGIVYDPHEIQERRFFE